MATFGLADTSDAALETKLDNGDILEGIRFHLEERKLGQGPGRRRRHNCGQGSIINDTGIEWALLLGPWTDFRASASESIWGRLSISAQIT